MQRAGWILIRCIRIEKRLIDLIVLNGRPLLIQRVNDSSKSKNLPFTFVKERTKLWEKDFGEIKKMFVEIFKPHYSRKDNLETIYDRRNAISHGHVSTGRDFVLYRPKNKRKIIFKLRKNAEIRPETKFNRLPFMLALRLADDAKYNKFLELITEFDEVYLKGIATSMGLDYNKIR